MASPSPPPPPPPVSAPPPPHAVRARLRAAALTSAAPSFLRILGIVGRSFRVFTSARSPGWVEGVQKAYRYHFRPEKPMELTIFFANAKNKIRMGSAATRTAAISPAQSGLPCGVWDLNTPIATVNTRAFSPLPTRRG